MAGIAMGGWALMHQNKVQAAPGGGPPKPTQCPCPAYCAAGWQPETVCASTCSQVSCAVRPLCSGCTE